jgi:hypothetical protein
MTNKVTLRITNNNDTTNYGEIDLMPLINQVMAITIQGCLEAFEESLNSVTIKEKSNS